MEIKLVRRRSRRDEPVVNRYFFTATDKMVSALDKIKKHPEYDLNETFRKFSESLIEDFEKRCQQNESKEYESA